MKKLLIGFLTVLTFAVSCKTAEVSGFYKTQDCGDYAVDCFMYNFHSDGRFTYWYSNSMIGEITLYGTYYILKDTIKLTPNKYIFHDTTKIEYVPKSNPQKTKINIALIPGFLINKPDTMHVPWRIKVNNAFSFDETDEMGNYTANVPEINKIEIQDYSAKYNLDSDMEVQVNTFYPEKKGCDINIYLASDILEPVVIPPVKKFLIKGRKYLIALNNNDSTSNNMFEATTNIYVKEKN